MNKTKLIRIKLTTWRELRRLVPGKRGETAAEYMERIKTDLLEMTHLAKGDLF